jgi:carbonic anhydrase
MELIGPAAASVGPQARYSNFADYLGDLERASTIMVLDNLMTFPCVRILVEKKRLELHAAYFDVATGLLSLLDSETKKFVSVAGAEHSQLFA